MATTTFSGPASTRGPHGQSEHTAAQFDALLGARHADPFSLLGPHREGERMVVRACLPGAQSVALADNAGNAIGPMQCIHAGGIFAGTLPDKLGRRDYRLDITWGDGTRQLSADPYSFDLLLGELDLHLIGEGRHFELGRCLGAQWMTVDGIEGVRFAVWAPNASRVSVIGDFNGWHPARHPMRLRYGAGVWELFVPAGLGVQPGSRYKFDLSDANGHPLPDKADPLALATELPPGTASVVTQTGVSAPPFGWTDQAWMSRRSSQDPYSAPMSIYEVHAGSWLREVNDPSRGWEILAERLIPYVRDLGFTHIELLPITEHPFGGSWGYQPLSLFAPTARFGPPQAFAAFVDRCHEAGIGVILDWVPAHFPTDPHGLAQFDGTALYEHQDPREGFHQDWNTLIYNLGRNEVRGFLLASALHWLREFHIDGLRVDAVASMLYRDYSRKAGQWVPNRFGGRENLEAVSFLRELNTVVRERCHGAMTIAEESTAWPGVTVPVDSGGLGFTFKWNMGWMHDTLRYLSHDPVHRAWHHQDMTFGMVYAWSEAFVLPLSHDEVVHGKGSLINKAPGDHWQKLANLRAYFGFMWTHPGKKLLFMGGELAQWLEWNHESQLDWALLDHPSHRGMQMLIRDLNRVYRELPALHACDHDPGGFSWVIGDDSHNSVFAYLRRAAPDSGDVVLAVVNMTPVPRPGYRLGVPHAGRWQEIVNTDAACYGGSNVGNGGELFAQAEPSHGLPASLSLTLPPLATLLLRHLPD
ncbi:1,4-alpha-glucan branching protein GlgB [Cupriavidus gilardii]|uniref:1,4-alpha-glucan branching protein GlgB n=1 Tax=Cupriavidus gilardii TaxID=82541 RepID=UPI0009EA5062|nr:1,4-alpha-glucan branching protein GlgB [Cupriavidus gilardii]MCT9013337.1 1,4-alpha-glucan branching protein GlgB [Cupriavidus gilardii]MCT9052891.1 1,4-alpha-glucan branching protein GlgB [Cupriavidus gilardii]WNG67801.1 1,4-alpha-glucan branching protein GlgB [Cupriavidus gilardii]